MLGINKIKQNLVNIPGWRTNRKIVVFESDDWGSIRTRSKKDLNTLRRSNINVDSCHYMLNDSLASETDLIELFGILTFFKDFKGNHPVFTANCLVANPDFGRIKDSNFSKYYFESFTKTLKNYPNHTNSYNLWKEGMNFNIFHPQSHGREHLNISRWMRDLQSGVKETHLIYKLRMFGLSNHISKNKRGSYQAAFDGGEKELFYNRNEIIKEGLSMFKNVFGYYSDSFISPNYIWDDEIEKTLFENKIKYIQSSRAQRISTDFGNKRKIKRHYLGQKNKYNQIYLVRNCNFEPSENHKDWISSCLKEIEIAFKWKKPAIISTHRVNYIGYINPKNRDLNLPLLKELITMILKSWPDTEFISSDQLGKLIKNNENSNT